FRPARGEATKPGQRASSSSSSARPTSARIRVKTSMASATGGLTRRVVDLRPGQTSPGRRTFSPEQLDRRVRLPPVGGLLRHAGAVARRELRGRVAHLRARARTDHQDHARAFAGTGEAVLGPRRTVEEVPGPQASFLALDEQRALA